MKKALAAVALTIAACGIAAVIRRHILCKRRRRGRKGETLGEQIQRIYRSFAALQKFNKKSVCSCQEERFAKQLGKKYPVFSEKTAQKLANIVLKACYSDQGLTKKSVSLYWIAMKSLQKLYQRSCRRQSVWWEA